MNLYLSISLISFAAIARIVSSNVGRVRRSEISADFRGVSLYDVASQTYSYLGLEIRKQLHRLLDLIMKMSHEFSLFLAHQFLRLARVVKGKRDLPQNRGSVTLTWLNNPRDRGAN